MGCEEHEFSNNYLILKPKDATLGDLFRFILPSSSGSKNLGNLVDYPEGEEERYTICFRSRWVLFRSILLLKFLLVVASTLKILNAFLNKLLNFVSFNGGVRGLFLKSIRGQLWVVPNYQTWTDYIPAVRCRDWRILDLNDTAIHNLPHNNAAFRYYSALTMMASTLAYQDYSLIPSVVNGCWQMNLLECYDFWNDFQDEATTHAFMFQNTATDPNVIVVAFRGTSMFEACDWMSDFNLSWYNIEGIGHIHSGFMQALGLQRATGWPKELSKPKHNFAYYTLRQKLRDIVKTNDKAKFIITGHSLGGALAILFVTVLGLHQESALLQRLQAVYTYGQPRLGDHQFAEFMVKTVQKYGFKYYRYVYSFDLVSRVPFDSVIFTYKHFGGCVYFDSCFNGKFLEEEPDKNYFSLIWLIPKYLTAWWELIRSLIVIPLVKGSGYFEGFVMILFRVFGLLIPGISAHMGPNYVNSTHWGKIQTLNHNNIETLILTDYIEGDY